MAPQARAKPTSWARILTSIRMRRWAVVPSTRPARTPLFLNVEDELGLGQLAAQAFVLSGQRLDASRLGQRGIDLAATFLRFQRGLFSGGALLAPGR